MTQGKKLSSLLRGMDADLKDTRGDILIRGIAFDSRRVEEGFLFVALPGLHTDGSKFIAEAAGRGAIACLLEYKAGEAAKDLPSVRVSDARAALSSVSARFYGEPSRALYVIGVTGTDGKSTTVYFIHQLLESLGFRSGFLSTVAYKAEEETLDNPFRQSTPEAPEIHELLARMVQSGKQFAVIEATSHGLSDKTKRLADVAFDAAVLTNVAHEHLEFHGTFEKYLDDKANLFRALGRVPAKNLSWPRTGVVNRDDPHWEYFTAATKIPCLFYGIDNMAADMSASSLAPNQGGTDFILKNRTDAFSARLPLAGVFNVENLLAAVCTVASISGENMARLIPLFAALKPVRGRMERVECGQGFRVIVDFAHTPQAFQKLLPGMRKETEGKLIVVFGSAGERDTGKRKMQGEVASRFADIIVLTDEDPRAEERLAILEEIASGCLGKHREENLFLIPERRQAIAKACALAEKGDTVLLLGKGHEKSIIYKDRVLPWNERAVAEEVLHELGY